MFVNKIVLYDNLFFTVENFTQSRERYIPRHATSFFAVAFKKEGLVHLVLNILQKVHQEDCVEWHRYYGRTACEIVLSQY